MAMTADEHDAFWARLYRFRASTYRALAARDEMVAKVIEAGTAMRQFAEAWRDAEAREVAEHPDLAELNVQLDGFYGDHR